MRIALLDSVVDLDLPRDVADRLAPALPFPTGRPPTCSLRLDPAAAEVRHGLQRYPVGSVEEAVSVLAALVNRIVLEQCRSLAFHSAAVAKDGRVVAFPAASGVGKSTLAAALLARGWDYVSDEALVLDATGDVRPYAKPLSLHAWSLERLGLAPAPAGRSERLVAPAELGASAATGRLALHHVVLLQRGARPALTALPRPEGTRHLLGHAFNHYRDPAAAFGLTARATAVATCWAVTAGDPVRTAQLVDESLQRASRQVG